jgi:Putative beta-barrel porin-2, OmpL-like. bbp2
MQEDNKYDFIWIALAWLIAGVFVLLTFLKMRYLLRSLVLFFSSSLFAQDSVKISGYVESYYLYGFDKAIPSFMYSHNRHNEINLNLGFLKANYSAPRVRANLALGAGAYMNANYAAEPGVLKNVFEANAGVKISNKKNLWIDAGILPSHIGFESAISKDCWTLTRSILADNSPYFEAGAKITYITNNGKWLLSGMVLNGWQRITRVNGNSSLNAGIQVQYKPSDNVLVNYSSFIGADRPDSTRFFHNFYGIFTKDKLGLILGFDIGTEEKRTWYSPVIILKYAFSDKWTIAARAEHYNDEEGVIIANGLETSGFSFNIDHSPTKNVVVRIEARKFSSNGFVASSIAVGF